MNKQRNCYEVMGLPTDATAGQVKKKYRELALRFHPDVAPDKAFGLCVFMQISQAYHVLGNLERRDDYDSTLQNRVLDALKAAPPPAPFAELLSRAESALLSGRPVEAQEFCQRILEIDPNQAQAIALFGDALARMGRTEEAAMQYRRALQLSPSALLQAKLNRIAPHGSALHLAPAPFVKTVGTVHRAAAPPDGSLLSRK